MYTWKSAGDGARNQIDYITINEGIWNSVTQVNSYHADCESDHNSIVAIVRANLRKLLRKKSQPQIHMLRSENEYKHKLCQQVSACIRDMARTDEMET